MIAGYRHSAFPMQFHQYFFASQTEKLQQAHPSYHSAILRYLVAALRVSSIARRLINTDLEFAVSKISVQTAL